MSSHSSQIPRHFPADPAACACTHAFQKHTQNPAPKPWSLEAAHPCRRPPGCLCPCRTHAGGLQGARAHAAPMQHPCMRPAHAAGLQGACARAHPHAGDILGDRAQAGCPMPAHACPCMPRPCRQPPGCLCPASMPLSQRRRTKGRLCKRAHHNWGLPTVRQPTAPAQATSAAASPYQRQLAAVCRPRQPLGQAGGAWLTCSSSSSNSSGGSSSGSNPAFLSQPSRQCSGNRLR